MADGSESLDRDLCRLREYANRLSRLVDEIIKSAEFDYDNDHMGAMAFLIVNQTARGHPTLKGWGMLRGRAPRFFGNQKSSSFYCRTIVICEIGTQISVFLRFLPSFG